MVLQSCVAAQAAAFLWQMALSLRIFGVSEWALRIPSVLMSALLVFPIFNIGQHFFDERTG